MNIAHRRARKDVPDFMRTLRSDLYDFNQGLIKGKLLRERYAPEYNSHRKALEREAKGVPSVPDHIRWFPDFLRLVVLEIGPRQPGTTLDRVTNHWREYAPKNLRWATAEEQAINRSTTKNYVLTHPATKEEITMTIPGFIASELRPASLTAATIRQRLSRGWPAQAAFFGGKHVRQKRTHRPLETPTQRMEVRVIEAYMDAICEHYPTMRDSIRKREREQLRRFSYDFFHTPDRAVKLIVARWSDCRYRLSDTCGAKLRSQPWPSELLKHVSPLCEAYLHFSNRDDTHGENWMREHLLKRQRNLNRLELVVGADAL